MSKKISNSRKAFPSRSMGPHVLQVIPSAISNIDPFVFLDHFGPFEKTPDRSEERRVGKECRVRWGPEQ